MKLDFDNIKGAIFDIDGTILDSMEIWEHLGERYLNGIGVIPISGLGETLFSMTLREGCQYIKNSHNLSQTVEEIEQGITDSLKDYYYNEVNAKQGASMLINELVKRRIPFVFATTGDEDLAWHALSRLGFLGYNSKIYCCNQYDTSKHESLIFDIAKAELERICGEEIDNSQIYVFEDSDVAVKTVKEQGYTVIGLADNQSMDKWQAIIDTADYFYYSLEEAFGNAVCPCCRNFTFEKMNSFEICDICGWENDNVQRKEPDYDGGANGVSLKDYIKNYTKM